MKISFFSLTEYVTDVDYSYVPGVPRIAPIIDEETGEIITPEVPEVPELGRPDCIVVFDIDFDPLKVYKLKKTKSKYELIVEDLPTIISPETEEEKRNRITNLLITSIDPTQVDTEGVTGFDIDAMILTRFFRGDRGKEIGFTQKFVYLQSIPERIPEEEQELETIKTGYLAKEEFKNYISSLK